MAHRSHFTLWGLRAVGAAVGDWIATAKRICTTLLFFSCSFFTSSHPPSLSTPSSPFYSFPFPFHLLQMSALEQEDLVLDDPGEDNKWQDKTHLHHLSLEMSPLAPTVSSKVLAPRLWQHLLLIFLILLVFHRTPSPISLSMSFCSTARSQDM